MLYLLLLTMNTPVHKNVLAVTTSLMFLKFESDADRMFFHSGFSR